MISGEHMSYKGGNTVILSDMCVQVETGWVTAVLGPNGSGKSTLLQCLAGSCRPCRGTVSLNGMPLADHSLAALSKKRAVLSQSNQINFPFTVQEIVMIGRHPYVARNNGGADNAIVSQVLASVDAQHLGRRIFSTLSGGEQQRVQLARVLAQLWEADDAYLFLDEPTAALDLKHQHQVLALVHKMTRERNAGVFMVLHDPNLALRYADRAILLKHGKVFASGGAEEVLTAKNVESVFDVPAELVFHSEPLRPLQPRSGCRA